ncbi:MAG: accessory Sec system translocase SecA2 [Bacillota bacterium]
MKSVKHNIYNKMNMALYRHRLKPYYEILKSIKSFQMNDWSDSKIKGFAQELRHKSQTGVPLKNLLTEAAALVGEAVWRLMRIRLYETQLVAGLALHDANMVEMHTGEGKTLSAVLPAYLNALQGKGSHIFTFNDYLASRDADWMGPVYQFLGLTVGCITEGSNMQERKLAYAADITYLTAKQACFDYLKDSLVYDVSKKVQRSLHFVLVDEADSILIDEARIPLVIAGKTDDTRVDFSRISSIVKQLLPVIDYDTDENERNVYLTEAGAENVESLLHCGNLYDIENSDKLSELNCALHAEVLLKKGVHYIVRDGALQLIDEFTGRIADKRHWPDGLQAAVEVKEGLKVQAGGKILGSMTLQHFLSLYQKICGMTATAQSSADEFRDIYALDVVIIPPNKPCQRIDFPHLIFSDKEAKKKAIITEIVSVHETGRPILVGTSSVEESNQLSTDLVRKGIPCHVLNAQHDQQEAEIISRAGVLGAVTVSTNMAGRGVDIILGGGDPEEYKKVVALGGLYVIGTNLHESSRVDKQLRGRAGRQGDPGSSRFIISLEDDILLKFGLKEALPKEYCSLRQETYLKGSKIQNIINHIQLVIEGQNYDIKKTLNKYADLLEQQRRILYARRTDVLFDIIKPSILASKEPEWYRKLCHTFGQIEVDEKEKYVLLVQIDKCWSDYLEYASYVKEGIHLESLSNKNPLDEYNRLIIQAYEEMNKNIETEVLHIFLKMDLTKEMINLDLNEMRIPSATWTYIINDNFFQNRVNLF